LAPPSLPLDSLNQPFSPLENITNTNIFQERKGSRDLFPRSKGLTNIKPLGLTAKREMKAKIPR
jgi:hypothetical protein